MSLSRNDLYKRYGLLLDRVGLELGLTKKECRSFVREFKGVDSIRSLSDRQLGVLILELIAYLAELGIEFYFGKDHSNKTLHELNKYYESVNNNHNNPSSDKNQEER